MAFCPSGPSMSEPPAYDIAQEREFYKYFQPIRLGLSGLRPKNDHSCPRKVHASPDRALTAFAQLATLRLNCRRSFISFFDRNHQYLVAEATRTLSLQTESAHAPGDEINYGASIVPKHGSICEHTLSAPFDIDRYITDESVFVVPDLRKDERFKHREYIKQKGWAFYAGTPIISPGGYKIGAYCVIDDHPREGLTTNEVAFLKDMATTVMVHMDMLRAQSESIKGERMVRGLGSFVEGKSRLEDWWMGPVGSTGHSTPGLSAPTPRWADNQYSRHHDEPSDIPLVHSGKNSSLDGLGVQLNIEQSPSRRGSQVSPNEPTKPMHAQEDPKAKKTSAQDNLPLEVKATFGRASYIIRESLQIDAVVIFDATARSTFGGLIDQASHERPKRRKLSCASDISDASSGTEQNSDEDDVALNVSQAEDKSSEILGFSTPDSSSIDEDQSAKVTDGITEGFLRLLLRRYPHGKVLNFDEEGNLLEPSGTLPENDTGSTSSKNTKRKRKDLRSTEAQTIRKSFPGARSLVIVPMWDSNQKFFSACVAWTVDPHRILTSDSELSYLAAFSDCAMSEVARINAKIADKAKSDFISSISHELRSPLHGILGSAECLSDSGDLDPFKENLVHTMETCGKTLLDTIDHLLDFAKINNFTRKSTQRRTNTSNPHEQKQNFALDVDVDLSVITEEVLESVFAGHDFVRTGSDMHKGVGEFSAPAPQKNVSIIVDIKKAVDSHWIFRTQAGAWRRILMNLFGNALKYTDHGFIQVKLDSEPLPKKDQGGRSKVTLSVIDSGKGMSQEYLSTKLFTPFAQEDSLQPGTGLGLAIISAIIKSMDGEIDVRSEEGKGTEVRVTLNMRHAPLDQDALEQSVISNAAKITKGLKIGFIGFGTGYSEKEPKPNTRSSENTSHRFMSSFQRMCQNWFSMDMHIVHDLDQADADMFLTTEEGLEEVQVNLKSRSGQTPKSGNQSDTAHKPLMVISNSFATASAMMHDPKSHVSGVISQPCGPRKLAKALMVCLGSPENVKTPNDRPIHKVLDSAQKQIEDDAAMKSRDEDVPLKHPREETLQIAQGRTRIPKADTASPPKTEPLSDDSHTDKRVCNVLLVDDNRINLQLLITYLRRSGHTFMTASNGLEAFETYKSQCKDKDNTQMTDPPFDFVLMDLSMPIMDGLESTRHIRAFERSSKTKPTTVIALTGLASASAQQEAFSSGVDTFMTKPVKLKELTKILEN